MTPTRQGSFRLFGFAGIDVFVHWSWFVVAMYEINFRAKSYSSLGWNVLEYLTLFLIVLLHEFGHSLACRQAGGRANQIVLWPLGGVAYVDPPPRPGATLWSIAAGPLVNVALFPVLTILVLLSHSMGWAATMPNADAFLFTVLCINTGLLIFNLLPIYPLDGGQILRSLLWFVLGRARSLMVASVIGFVGVAAIIVFGIVAESKSAKPVSAHTVLVVVICGFILLNCWGGLRQARALSRAANSPRYDGLACPACKSAPPAGAFWLCSKCRTAFDTFATQAVCPHCGTQFGVTRCLDCGGLYPLSAWMIAAPAPPRL